MKKIKLITGLSALSILSIAALPLTSCSKFDGRVTEQEWKDALDYLTVLGEKKHHWSFGDNSSASFCYSPTVYDSDTYKFTNLVATDKGWSANVVNTYEEEDEPTIVTNYDCYETLLSEFSYQCNIDNDTHNAKYELYPIYYRSLHTLIDITFNSVYDYYNDFKFENGQYICKEEQLESGYVFETRMSFNKDKKLSYIKCSMIAAKKDHGSIESLVVNNDFSINYDVKEITWPEGFFDRVKRHYFKLENNQAIFDTSICVEEDEGLVVDAIPTESGFSKFSAKRDGEVKKMLGKSAVCINGEQYTRIEIYNNQLLFHDKLAKGCNLSVVFKPESTDGEYTFILEAA